MLDLVKKDSRAQLFKASFLNELVKRSAREVDFITNYTDIFVEKMREAFNTLLSNFKNFFFYLENTLF